MTIGIAAAERGLVPDWAVRAGIRSLLRQRLNDQVKTDASGLDAARDRHLAAMRNGPIAQATDAANAQHYAVPAAFFEHVLGPHLKYSCCHWTRSTSTLGGAEEAMLELTSSRVGAANGMRMLDLGCGWGSWSLWAAERFPQSRIVAVSNSAGQRMYIERERARRGIGNLDVITADVNSFEPDGAFDRIVSIEMFEHMRNYERLLSRIQSWLRPDGRLFVHIFCHRGSSYFFEETDGSDWMARNFFSGGMMPSDRLLFEVETGMEVERHWPINGRDYERTARAWLGNLDDHRAEVEAALTQAHGPASVRTRVERWRLFFLACAELFGYRNGEEWFVSHYLLAPRR